MTKELLEFTECPECGRSVQNDGQYLMCSACDWEDDLDPASGYNLIGQPYPEPYDES